MPIQLHFTLSVLNIQQPLPKSKKTSSKGGKKERSSSGTARKAKLTKCPEILTDESSSEDEKKEKDESSEEDKESEEEVKSVCKPQDLKAQTRLQYIVFGVPSVCMQRESWFRANCVVK